MKSIRKLFKSGRAKSAHPHKISATFLATSLPIFRPTSRATFRTNFGATFRLIFGPLSLQLAGQRSDQLSYQFPDKLLGETWMLLSTISSVLPSVGAAVDALQGSVGVRRLP